MRLIISLEERKYTMHETKNLHIFFQILESM